MERSHKGKPLINVDTLSELLNEYISDIDLTYFWLEGEVQNLRDSNSHLYFSLSNNKKSIKCIIWDSIKEKNNIKIENGFKGKFMGKLNYYETKNDLSFVIYSLDLDGIGNLYNELEQTKQYCISKNFFQKEKAKIINLKNILIITRFESAAYNDIIHSIISCYDLNVYILDSFMQGENARSDLVKNINLAEKYSKQLKLDAIIISRGGGSIDDLWVFNNKEILERIFKCKIPIMTAIGHDIDHTLCDDLADKSFITPTELGKFIYKLKNKEDKLEKIFELKLKLYNDTKRLIEDERSKLDEILKEINPDNMINHYREKQKILYSMRKILVSNSLSKYKENLLNLDTILLKTSEYINLHTKIVLYKNDKQIIDKKNIKSGEYSLSFNGKKYLIEVIKEI